MKHYLLHILCLLLTISLSAQENMMQYNLEVGSTYVLVMKMNQNTITENSDLRGSASLDISCRIYFEVLKVNESGDFEIQCRYDKAKLSFLSPNSRQSISSLDPQFSSLHQALRTLEEQSFQLTLSPFGELKDLENLDENIQKAFGEDAEEGNESLKNSVLESFGSSALRNLSSIALNLYSKNLPLQNEIESGIYLNARSMLIRNKFYYQATTSNDLRVQGIGVIPEREDVFETEEMKLKTILKGNQTYDYLVSGTDGWMIEGMSKQKIHTLSEIDGDGNEFPRGLKIPSYTTTEYEFRGEKLKNEQK